MTTAVRAPRGGTDTGPGARGARRALLPLGIAAGGLALAVGAQLVFDPFRTDIPLCIVHHLTGLHCPGCGAVRSVHALLDGNLWLALRNNAVIVIAVPLVAIGLLVWIVQRVRGRPTDLWPPQRVVLTLFVLMMLYTVARNLPAFWFIAPTSLVGA